MYSDTESMRAMLITGLITGLITVLLVPTGCSFYSATTPSTAPTADPTTGSEEDELAELLRTNAEGISHLEEFSDFCSAVNSEQDLEPAAPEVVLARFRSALEIAPERIVSELEALLEYLEFGILPDFGTVPLPSATVPIEDPAPELDSEPVDEYVFINPVPEQLALSVAEFIDQHCRSVTVSPLPPPTVPSAATPDYDSDS
jgi:hypothetical protein